MILGTQTCKCGATLYEYSHGSLLTHLAGVDGVLQPGATYYAYSIDDIKAYCSQGTVVEYNPRHDVGYLPKGYTENYYVLVGDCDDAKRR